MRELAVISRKLGDADKALAFETWAEDALAAGARLDEPVDPAVAPRPTVGRVARALLEQATAGNGTTLPAWPAPALAAT
jgi:hypothetical protein